MFVTGSLNRLICGGIYVKSINRTNKTIINIESLFPKGNPKISNFEDIASPIKRDMKNKAISSKKMLFPIIPV